MIKEKFEILTENEILTYFSEFAEPLLEKKNIISPNETIDFILKKLDYIKCNNKYLIISDNNHIEYNRNHTAIILKSKSNSLFKIECNNYEISSTNLYEMYLIKDLEELVSYLRK